MTESESEKLNGSLVSIWLQVASWRAQHLHDQLFSILLEVIHLHHCFACLSYVHPSLDPAFRQHCGTRFSVVNNRLFRTRVLSPTTKAAELLVQMFADLQAFQTLVSEPFARGKTAA